MKNLLLKSNSTKLALASLVFAFLLVASSAVAALNFDSNSITSNGLLNLNSTGQPVIINDALTFDVGTHSFGDGLTLTGSNIGYQLALPGIDTGFSKPENYGLFTTWAADYGGIYIAGYQDLATPPSSGFNAVIIEGVLGPNNNDTPAIYFTGYHGQVGTPTELGSDEILAAFANRYGPNLVSIYADGRVLADSIQTAATDTGVNFTVSGWGSLTSKFLFRTANDDAVAFAISNDAIDPSHYSTFAYISDGGIFQLYAGKDGNTYIAAYPDDDPQPDHAGAWGFYGDLVPDFNGYGSIGRANNPWAGVYANSINLGSKLLSSSTAPTISSGFGTSSSVTANNGTAAFRVNVGTGGAATTGVVGLPAAATGWNCYANDITNPDLFVTSQTASTTTTASFKNYSRTTGAATAWTASDVLAISCFAY